MNEQLALQFPEQQPDVTLVDVLCAIDRGMQTLNQRVAQWVGPRVAYLRANEQPVNGLTVLLAPPLEDAA